MAYLICRSIPKGRRIDVYTGVEGALKVAKRHRDTVEAMVEVADVPEDMTAEELLAFYDSQVAVTDNHVDLGLIL